jgi:hypothetical protein
MDNSDFEREFPYVPEFAQNPHTLVGKRVVVGGIHSHHFSLFLVILPFILLVTLLLYFTTFYVSK